MKTNTKIEIGILAFAAILSLIFQVYIKSVSAKGQMEEIELKGELITKNFPINGFTALDSELELKVEYYVGEPRVEVTTDEAFLQNIKVEQEGKTLRLWNDSGFNKRNNQLRRVSTVKVYNDQSLGYIKSGENSRIKIIDINLANTARFYTNGNSSISGPITVDSIYINSDGNSSVNFEGAAKYGNIDTKGNSQYKLGEMEFISLELYSNGNSGGEAKVIESVNAKADGNSHVKIFGDPTKTRVNSSGNSHINLEE